MKKENKTKRIIFVLTNSKEDGTYIGNRVIAEDTKEKLEAYKNQLIKYGYNDDYNIEEQEHDGWSSVIRFSGYNLKEYDGLLYPSRNIEFAREKVSRKLSSLKSTYDNLKELSEEMSDDEKLHCDAVLKMIEKKYNDITNEKLQVKMLL